jgi:hypothetical protein
MSAPNRFAVINSICAAHPEAFEGPPETHDARRLKLLREHIIPTINLLDGGRWGLLRKNDRGGHIPPDVIVWKDTLEHFDVLSPTGAMWNAHGPIRASWAWEPVFSVVPPAPANPPTTEPTPAPVVTLPSPDYQELVRRVNELEARVHELEEKPLPRYVGKFGPFTLVSTPER